jgi:hypothetical protein
MNAFGRIIRALLVLVVLVGLVWAGWLVVSRLQLDSEEDDTEPIRVTAVVETRTLERTVATRGVFGFGPGEEVVVGGAGRITAVWVSDGSVVEAGDLVVEVEGRPMVAVEGSRPLWRDLTLGDRGSDVGILQEILGEAGYLDVEADGRFGAGTRDALQEWQEDHGFLDADGVFRVNDWLVGSWPSRIGHVSVDTGGFLQPGSVLLTLTEADSSVSIELTPSDRLRVNVGDLTRVEVAATGQAVEGMVDGVGVTAESREDGSLVYRGRVVVDDALEVPEGTEVRVTIVVDRADGVMTVPLASLVSDAAGAAAVQVVRTDGSVETVPVVLGLSEGAWVEVVSGLNGDELVLVAGQ